MPGRDEVKVQPGLSSSLGKQIVGVALAVLFLWLAFRGADPSSLWGYIKQVQPVFLFTVCLSALASHFLRAWRWVLLLAPLSKGKVSLWNSFCAVMYGYAVNVVVPRGGEVARLVSMSRMEKLPWAGVLSTMFIDRLLDLALLVLLLGITLAVYPLPASANMDWLVPGGILLSVAAAGSLFLLPQISGCINWLMTRPQVACRISASLSIKIEALAAQFDTGCSCLKNPRVFPAIAASSMAIWFFYWLNVYLMIWAFRLSGQVSPSQSLLVFTIGSVGVLVPTPGNVGSFHYLVSQALCLVAAVPGNQSLAFASLLHALCLVVIPCLLAAVCFVAQNFTQRRRQEPDSTVASGTACGARRRQ